ncbi:hypothetical protein [Bacillus ndiopicus]|uniref:hypothetical protein n=1 Tax=Bacillus ndiopicus TaxID=1347368 RepID=UPI000AA4679F|nr:hypothetical protein [Bacillus ndiopicus]
MKTHVYGIIPCTCVFCFDLKAQIGEEIGFDEMEGVYELNPVGLVEKIPHDVI